MAFPRPLVKSLRWSASVSASIGSGETSSTPAGASSTGWVASQNTGSSLPVPRFISRLPTTPVRHLRLLVAHVGIERATVDELREPGLELGPRAEEQIRSERVHRDEQGEPRGLRERGRREQGEGEEESAGHRGGGGV